MTCQCERLAGPGAALSPTCIGHLWIFQDLRPEELDALGREALRREIPAGSPLFLQGDPALEMFLIKGGRIKLCKVLEDGTEITLDFRKAGDFVGENVLAETGNYPVSAYCLEPTLCCGFSRSQLERIILANPNIGLQIIRNLSERVTRLTTRVGSLGVTSIEERLHHVISDVAREHGSAQGPGILIRFPLTHEELGFLIGAHRVSVTRAMKNLKAAGKIAFRDRNLIVTELAP